MCHAFLREPGSVRDAKPGVAQQVDVRGAPHGIVAAVASLNREVARRLDKALNLFRREAEGRRRVSVFGGFIAAIGFSVNHFAAVQKRKKVRSRSNFFKAVSGA